MGEKINGETVIIALTSLIVVLGTFVVIFAAMVASQDARIEAAKTGCTHAAVVGSK